MVTYATADNGPAAGIEFMRWEVTKTVCLVLILGLGAGLALAQDSSSQESLGDLARKLKAQRAKSQEKSKVYTNDDLEALPPSSGHSTAPAANPSGASKNGNPGVSPAKEKGGKETEVGSGGATAAQSGKDMHGDSYYRQRLSELEDRLDIDERELSVLKQQLGQGQMMYYSDPYQGLLQSSGPTAMSDVNHLQDQIAKKQAKIAADQEDIENLREELRRDGGDPGWLRLSNPTAQASEPAQPAAQPELPQGQIGTKEYWQDRFKSARARLSDARERQQLVEDELHLLQIQEVRTLNPEAKSEFTAQVDAKEEEAAQRRAATEQAKKALENLQKEFAASGAPQEWLAESEGDTP